MDKTVPQQLESLLPLLDSLKRAENWEEKLQILDSQQAVINFLEQTPQLAALMPDLPLEGRIVLDAVIVIGQAPLLLPTSKWPRDMKERLYRMIDQLLPVEKFYKEIGGIVGYHCMVLKFLSSVKEPTPRATTNFYPATGLDISKESKEVAQAKIWGIEAMPVMAEIYALGGAADRLRLYDEATGTPLPATRLRFGGRTLLENLIVDLQGREYLYYKLLGKQFFTPIAMMTSPEKENHAHALAICEEKEWFGRPKELFRFFCQPLVPTINTQGRWCITGPMKLLMKPGGHGVLWKLARDEGIFTWLDELGKKKALIRQINNPIAGTDYGLLAFTGIGCKRDKTFGFASCERQVKASEGVNVLLERKTDTGIEYALTNIEYCDFTRFGIEDEPKEEGGSYSKFPSNTNILFADLRAVEEASIQVPMPGLLINLKKTVFLLENGRSKEEEVARLESTMQNIADHFLSVRKEPCDNQEDLPTFVTFNERRKTISTTKREFSLGSSLLETPEGCFLDQLKNGYQLLHDYCGFDLPEVTDAADFFNKGPPFLFFYHPALGPFYEIIAQKLRGGKLARAAELQLDLAEVDIENLDLKGSLIIEADAPMGRKDEQGLLRFDLPGGRCRLHNVTVKNRGIDRCAHQIFWRNEISRKECCKIVLLGMSEFEAHDVELEGNITIEVEHGYRVTAFLGKTGVEFRKEEISKPSWNWVYTKKKDNTIALSKKSATVKKTKQLQVEQVQSD